MSEFLEPFHKAFETLRRAQSACDEGQANLAWMLGERAKGVRTATVDIDAQTTTSIEIDIDQAIALIQRSAGEALLERNRALDALEAAVAAAKGA